MTAPQDTSPPSVPLDYDRRPARRWVRHVRRAAYALLTLVLVLAAVWGWFYWGWYSERQILLSLKLDPSNPKQVTYSPILTSWPKQHLGPLGFVLDRVDTVNLHGHPDVTDLAPLARLTNLQALNLYSTGVTDVAPLARLTNLQRLFLTGTRVTDLAPLARLTNLRLLWLSDTGVTDLAPLARLTNLEWLSLSNTPVTDLAPLRGLNLQRLYLTGTRVTDLAPLSGLKSLRLLTLPGVTIPEAHVEALRRDLPGCRIERHLLLPL